MLWNLLSCFSLAAGRARARARARALLDRSIELAACSVIVSIDRSVAHGPCVWRAVGGSLRRMDERSPLDNAHECNVFMFRPRALGARPTPPISQDLAAVYIALSYLRR